MEPELLEMKMLNCMWCYEPFGVSSEACGYCSCPKCGKRNQLGECGG